MPQSVYYKIQILCLGSTKMCLVMTRYIFGWASGQSGEKKERSQCFSTFCNKDPLMDKMNPIG